MTPTKTKKVELKTTRLFDLISFSIIGIAFVVALVHFALAYGHLVFYLAILASVLISIGLLIYIPIKLYSYTITSVDEIILNEI